MPDPIMISYFALVLIAVFLTPIIRDLVKATRTKDNLSIDIDMAFIIFFAILIFMHVSLIILMEVSTI